MEDKERFEKLLDPVLGLAYRYAYRLTGNAEDAMDLVQEATLRAFKAFATFEDGSNFRAWFLKILTNRYLKDRARNARVRTESYEEIEEHPGAFGDLLMAGDHQVDDSVFDKIDAEAVREAIDSLPEEFRMASLLYFLQDASYLEIAEILDTPVGTVRSRLHRGRKLLQKRLWDIAAARGWLEANIDART